LKIQKTQSGEHIPPPRPKRKSSTPYPVKNKSQRTENINPETSSAWFSTLEGQQYLSQNQNWVANSALFNPPGFPLEPNSLARYAADQQNALASITSPLFDSISQSNSTQVPNFAKIYAFLGSLFDPSTSNHMEALEEMSPLDKETVQLLMHNLAINLANKQLREQHTLLLEQYRSLLLPQPDNEESKETDDSKTAQTSSTPSSPTVALSLLSSTQPSTAILTPTPTPIPTPIPLPIPTPNSSLSSTNSKIL